MKIVVFGSSGFLGSHVFDILREKGHDVLGFDHKGSRYIKTPGRAVLGNILDKNAVMKVTMGAEAVYNFAGITDIEESKSKPFQTIEHNVLGNSIILEACRANRVSHFLYASSVYVYSRNGSFYRTSKRACELVIEDYHKAYGIDYTIMRYGSLYGPRSDGRNWIYSMLKQALRQGKITRNGDGEEVREYIHVRDAARMSADMLDKKYKNQYVIISGSQVIKIKDLLVMVREMLNNNVKIEYLSDFKEEHYEVTPYSFNPTIAKKIVSDSYLDLGQGLLEVMDSIHKERIINNENYAGKI